MRKMPGFSMSIWLHGRWLNNPHFLKALLVKTPFECQMKSPFFWKLSQVTVHQLELRGLVPTWGYDHQFFTSFDMGLLQTFFKHVYQTLGEYVSKISIDNHRIAFSLVEMMSFSHRPERQTPLSSASRARNPSLQADGNGRRCSLLV